MEEMWIGKGQSVTSGSVDGELENVVRIQNYNNNKNH